MPIQRAEMSASALRPVAPRAFRRNGAVAPVETLVARVGDLQRKRQELRGAAVGPAVLERNRRALARAHWELSHALIDRHLPPGA